MEGRHFTEDDELFLFETFVKLTSRDVEKNCLLFDSDESDIPLSEFFLFEKDAEYPSPMETSSPDSDTSQAFFPSDFSQQSSPSPCESPISIFPPLRLDSVFTCPPSPVSLSPTSPPTTPFLPSSPIPQQAGNAIQTAYTPPPTTAETAKVNFIDLKDLYEKTQVRRGGTSEQRLVDCRVHMFANYTGTTALYDIEVDVQRYPETDKLEDIMQFPVTVEKTLPNTQYFSINLDAVYLTALGKKFYQLSTTDRFKKNRFIISVTLTFADDSRARFKSEPFLIRSRKQSPNPRKPRSYSQ